MLNRLLAKLFRLAAGFFRLFFRIFFHRLLVKIYFEIFRFRKNNLQGKTSYQLFKKNLSFLFIIIISIVLITTNARERSRAQATPENKISKTIMADLVRNEFSYLGDEELIEESYTPGSLKTIGQEKYYSDSIAAIKKQPVLSGDNLAEGFNPMILINEEAVAVKPRVIGSRFTTEQELIPEKRTEIVLYTVQKGDAVSTIAQRFGLTVNTILWANNLGAYSLIRPGDVLTILPESGILHTVKSGDTISKIAKLYDVEEEKILASNQLASVLKIGDQLMVPGGRKITVAAAPKPVAAPTNTTGLGIIRDLVKAPDAPAAVSSDGKMAWPTEGNRITQYFSWRHTGLDIANKTGTPLYAAEAGTVEFAGWGNGYGYNVLIDHGGGKKTRYAHASKMFVKAGDTVSRGENIAAMGSTGWSTGPHLHFEVIINGAKQNPLNYIK